MFSFRACSSVKKTAERAWHYQIVHHNLWNYDLPTPPVLVDINVYGKEIKAVAQVMKQAFTFVFDRVTGDPIRPIEEVKLSPGDVSGEKSSPTQPFPPKPAPFDRQGVIEDDLIDFTPERVEKVISSELMTKPPEIY